MTGRYSPRASLGTIFNGGTRRTLRAGENALRELFQSRGCTTTIEGKRHLGAAEQSWPRRQGLDERRAGVIDTPDGRLYRRDAARERARGRDRG